MPLVTVGNCDRWTMDVVGAVVFGCGCLGAFVGGGVYERRRKARREEADMYFTPVRVVVESVAAYLSFVAHTLVLASVSRGVTQYPVGSVRLVLSASLPSFCGPSGWLALLCLALGGVLCGLTASVSAKRPFYVPDVVFTALALHVVVVSSADRAFPTSPAFWTALAAAWVGGSLLGTLVNYRMGILPYLLPAAAPEPSPPGLLSTDQGDSASSRSQTMPLSSDDSAMSLSSDDLAMSSDSWWTLTSGR